MRISLVIPTVLITVCFVADRLRPGYGQFAIQTTVTEPISKVFDGPRDCSRALSRAEFNTLKRMKGATRAELAAALAGAACETGIRLDFSPKKVKPKIDQEGKLEGLTVI